MKTADEILSMVNEFLANLPYERKPKSLYEPIRYVLSMGGKRIRPTLMLLGYNLFKDNPEKILMNAVALETYHNYTLNIELSTLNFMISTVASSFSEHTLPIPPYAQQAR